MATFYGNVPDSDVTNWYVNVTATGATVPLSFVGGVYNMVYTLKQQNIWNLIYEMYILCGVSSLSGVYQKLKNAPGKSSVLTDSSNYTYKPSYSATGPGAGLSMNGSNFYFITGVNATDLSANNRSVGVYETYRPASYSPYYTVLIGRDNNGGANTGFGPTIQPNNISQWRLLDTTNQVYLGSPALSSVAGFFSLVSNSTTQYGTALGVQYPGTYTIPASAGGSGGYLMGSPPLGGGGFNSSTISFAFIGYGMTSSQLAILDNAVNTLMKSIGANVY